MKPEKATAVVLVVVGVVVLGIVGLGYYAFKNPIIVQDDKRSAPLATGQYATSTISYTTTTTSSAESEDGDSESRVSSSYSGGGAPRSAVSRASAYSGPAYRNSAFGLTVPGNFQAVPSQSVYGGVPTSASYAFYTNGVYAYTINIFSKEQWNNIRIQETINAKEGTGPDYLGEGRYLGENKTWIYSYIPGSYMPSGASFY